MSLAFINFYVVPVSDLGKLVLGYVPTVLHRCACFFVLHVFPIIVVSDIL